jgi:hypothetical protein
VLKCRTAAAALVGNGGLFAMPSSVKASAASGRAGRHLNSRSASDSAVSILVQAPEGEAERRSGLGVLRLASIARS